MILLVNEMSLKLTQTICLVERKQMNHDLKNLNKNKIVAITNIGIPSGTILYATISILVGGGFQSSPHFTQALILIIGRLLGASITALVLLAVLSFVFGFIPYFILRNKIQHADRYVIGLLYILFSVAGSILLIVSN